MKLLVLTSVFPQPDKNSGCLRLVEILNILLNDGHEITALALNVKEDRYRRALEDNHVKCVTREEVYPEDRVAEFRQYLRSNHFDIVIFERYEVYVQYASYIRAFLPHCWCILDTVDLHFVRAQREAALESGPVSGIPYEEVWANETGAIRDADAVWVVTEVEREVLLAENLSAPDNVHVVPNIHRLASFVPGYAERNGVVFLGGYSHPPNIDAVKHLMDDVVPYLRSALPEVQLTIAGSNTPQHFHAYSARDKRVKVTGFVEDHRALLLSHLVGVAPLRYGAGMKGKIGEYMSCGLPCVTTSIGAEGMGIRHEKEVLLADAPSEFCNAIVRLSKDPVLWKQLSEAGMDYIQRNLSSKSIAPLVVKATSIPPRRRRRHAQSLLGKALRSPLSWGGLAGRAFSAFRRGGLEELISSTKQWSNRI